MTKPQPKQLEEILDEYYDGVIKASSSNESDERVELAILQLQRNTIKAIRTYFKSLVPEVLEGLGSNDYSMGYDGGWNECRKVMLSKLEEDK